MLLDDVTSQPLPRGADQFRWNEAERLIAHRNMHRIFPSYHIRAGEARPLGSAEFVAPFYRYQGATHDLNAYMARTNCVGLIALKQGKVRLERYAAGNGPKTLWASRSMAKTVTALLIGLAIREGHISSIEDEVVRYIPELRGTLYEGVRLRHVLQMTSGVPYTEDYLDPTTDVFKLQACTISNRVGAFLEFLIELGRRPAPNRAAPGESFVYSSADSVVVGLVLERAIGLPPSRYLEERIWRPCGMEHDAYWNAEAMGGTTFTASGLCVTLRDYARLGQLLLVGARLPDGTALVPDDWMKEAITPSEASIRAGKPYGFQVWRYLPDGMDPPEMALRLRVDLGDPMPTKLLGGESCYFAIGNNGQFIAVNPAEELVVVKLAYWNTPPQLPSGPHARNEDMVMLAAVAEALH
jgi:CubicO group peptidase (beta-lactamase class C family)